MTNKARRSFLGVVAALLAVTPLMAVAVLGQVGAPVDVARGSMSGLQSKEHSSGPMDSGSLILVPPVAYDAGATWATGVAVADVNGDGKLDLLVSNAEDTVGVLLGNGDGTFQPAVMYGADAYLAYSVAAGDLNGDGKIDFVVANYCAGIHDCIHGSVSVLLGNGDGTFQTAVAYSAGEPASGSIAIVDVNGDGKPDVVLPVYSGSGLGTVTVLLGKGDGTFQAPATYSSGDSSSSLAAAAADLNGDGKPDLVVTNADGTVSVLLSKGSSFQTAVTYSTGGSYPHSVAIADVNGDGKLDVLVANQESVGVLLGNGDGTLQPVVTYATGGASPASVALADVNADGVLDIVVANSGYLNPGTVGVLLGNGNGTFQPVVMYSSGGVGELSASVVVADVNGDGKPDIVAINECGASSNCGALDGTVGVLLNNVGATPTTITLVSSLNPATMRVPVTYTATVSSQDGGGVTGSVVFQDGGATIATVPVAGNQAAYTTTYTNGGSHKMTATYPGDPHNLGSKSATLVEFIQSVASKTVLSSSGSPSLLSQAVTFTATVTSARGAIPDGELVTFYDGSATLGSVALVGGVAAYTTSSLSAKVHTIKAAYSGDATFAPSSGSVKQVVEKYPTTTALSSSVNPSAYGQAVTFTATVTSTGPYPPTGKVVFRDGTTWIGSSTLSGGIATRTKSNLAVGSHPITAQYQGDAVCNKSTSAGLDQVVQ